MFDTIYYDTLQFADYKFLIAVSDKGLVYLDIISDEVANVTTFFAKYKETIVPVYNSKKVAPYKTQLVEYLQGKRQVFDMAIDFGVRGTSFQQEVWQELLKVPFGESSSYSLLAEAVGRPQATRAVGTAVGKNPIPIIVPCHRILRKDGGIGGYAGGLPLKYRLLAIEGISCK